MKTLSTSPPAAADLCRNCRAPLAADQRYCLNCGRRCAEAHVPFSMLAPEAEPPAAAAPVVAHPDRIGGAALAALVSGFAALLLALGILIGAVSADKETQLVQARVPPQKAPVVNITNTGGGGAESTETLTSDWVAGEEGFTVQLETFANDGSVPVSEVEAAKTDAASKGAEEVGALNSDEFSSLEPGLYVVYSGAFIGKDGKAKAQAALGKLKKDFPGAKVVKVAGGAADTGAKSSKQVGDEELKDLAGSTGEEQQKKSAQLPEELDLGGAPPPKDNAAPGGGEGGGVDIE